jgi:hypothetical protein
VTWHRITEELSSFSSDFGYSHQLASNDQLSRNLRVATIADFVASSTGSLRRVAPRGQNVVGVQGGFDFCDAIPVDRIRLVRQLPHRFDVNAVGRAAQRIPMFLKLAETSVSLFRTIRPHVDNWDDADRALFAGGGE